MLCPVTMLNPMLLAIQASAAACAVDAAINTRADPIHAPIDTTPERLTRTSFELNQEGSVFRRDFDPDNLASDELWNVHVGKGEKFTCRMKATDAGAGWLIGDQRKPPSAVSPWKGDLKKELQDWFWHIGYTDSDDCDFEYKKLKFTFDGLGISPKPRYDDNGNEIAGGQNECFKVKHFDSDDVEDPNAHFSQMKPVQEQKYKTGNKWYSATGAYYLFGINVKEGAMFGLNLESPSIATTRWTSWRRKAEPGELPELQYLSDILWGHWIRNNPDLKNLHLYLTHDVVNPETRKLAASAFARKKLGIVKPWPGDVFETNTEEGKALLGSPLGGTIANLLSRHKDQLGIKYVSKVRIVTRDPPKHGFGSKHKHEFHVIFHIEDVPADQVPEYKPEDKTKRSERVIRQDESENAYLHVQMVHI